MAARKNPYSKPDAKSVAARAAGYPARSVFKLEEIDRRVRLLKGGLRVLDLGAAPGSWTLYASQKVGSSGRVVAVDLKQIQQAMPPHVILLTGDALSLGGPSPTALVGDSSASDVWQVMVEQGPYDVVLSDMAPSTTGSKVSDQARSFELVMRAIAVADALAAPRSHFVAKMFMSADFPDAREALRQRHSRCQVIRPEGTRQNSSEVFLVGLERKSRDT